MKNKILLIASILLLLLVITMSILTGSHKFDSFDNKIANSFISSRGEKYSFWYYFAMFFTQFGSVLGTALIVVVLFILRRFDKRCWLFFGCLLSATLIMLIIKNVVKRPRLDEILMWDRETSYSFPSGHSTGSSMLYSSMIYFLLNSKFNNILKKALIALSIFLLIIIPITRMMLAVHYFTDVITGMILGISSTLIFIYLDNYVFKLNDKSN